MQLSARLRCSIREHCPLRGVTMSGQAAHGENPSWSEFSAVRRRQRSVVERLPADEGETANGKPGTKPNARAPPADNAGDGSSQPNLPKASSGGRMAFIVSPASKAAMVGVVGLDCIAGVTRLLRTTGSLPSFWWLPVTLTAVSGAKCVVRFRSCLIAVWWGLCIPGVVVLLHHVVLGDGGFACAIAAGLLFPPMAHD